MTRPPVKPKTASEVEKKLNQLALQYPQGFTHEDVRKELKGVQETLVLEVINLLIRKKRFNILQDGNTVIYKKVSDELVDLFQDLKQEDLLIYHLIEEKGNVGISTKDLKLRTKMQTKKINQILKILIAKKLVKQVQTIVGKRSKVYMLSSLEPSSEITGGVWFKFGKEGAEFNYELVNELREAAMECLTRRKIASTEDILHYAMTMGINTELAIRKEDMQTVMDTLVYDNMIELVDEKMGKYRKTPTPTPDMNPFSEIPCSYCPVFHECHDKGDITPLNCVYYDKFLDF